MRTHGWGGNPPRDDDEAKARILAVTREQIDWYVSTGEPMDKAGSYAIQGGAACFVETIEGSVTNVIGLPLTQLIDLIVGLGIDVTSLRSGP